jgi:hypothetical protein
MNGGIRPANEKDSVISSDLEFGGIGKKLKEMGVANQHEPPRGVTDEATSCRQRASCGQAGLGLDMAPTILYHCPCLSNSPVPPPPHLPSSAASFHALHTLYFCHECNAIRCNRCVSVEVSGYYCPNCLFEVPSASVRAEKNRRVLYSVMLSGNIEVGESLDAHGIASCVLTA